MVLAAAVGIASLSRPEAQCKIDQSLPFDRKVGGPRSGGESERSRNGSPLLFSADQDFGHDGAALTNAQTNFDKIRFSLTLPCSLKLGRQYHVRLEVNERDLRQARAILPNQIQGHPLQIKIQAALVSDDIEYSKVGEPAIVGDLRIWVFSIKSLNPDGAKIKLVLYDTAEYGQKFYPFDIAIVNKTVPVLLNPIQKLLLVPSATLAIIWFGAIFFQILFLVVRKWWRETRSLRGHGVSEQVDDRSHGFWRPATSFVISPIIATLIAALSIGDISDAMALLAEFGLTAWFALLCFGLPTYLLMPARWHGRLIALLLWSAFVGISFAASLSGILYAFLGNFDDIIKEISWKQFQFYVVLSGPFILSNSLTFWIFANFRWGTLGSLARIENQRQAPIQNQGSDEP